MDVQFDTQYTDRGERIDTTTYSSIAEGGVPPVSATAASSGSNVLPTPRTELAEILGNITLGSRPPAQNQ